MEPGREKHNVSKRRGQASVCIPVHLSRVNNVWAFFPCAWAWPFQRVRVETTTESILTLGSKVRQMTNASCVFPNEHKLQRANPTRGISKCAFRLENKTHISRCLSVPVKTERTCSSSAREPDLLRCLQHHASTESGRGLNCVRKDKLALQKCL